MTTAPRSSIATIAFDIGETLLDRTREYAAWARVLGVPAHTFSAVFGAMINQGAGVSEVIDFFAAEHGHRPDRSQLTHDGGLSALAETDLYPDARAALSAMQQLGLTVIIAGNQPVEIAEQLRALALPADIVATSSEWLVAKPAPAFFARIAAEAGCRPDQIVYVGDQLDNDVLAALSAGMRAVRLRRGPWGYLQRDPAIEARCLAVISSLDELAGVVAAELT